MLISLALRNCSPAYKRHMHTLVHKFIISTRAKCDKTAARIRSAQFHISQSRVRARISAAVRALSFRRSFGMCVFFEKMAVCEYAETACVCATAKWLSALRFIVLSDGSAFDRCVCCASSLGLLFVRSDCEFCVFFFFLSTWDNIMIVEGLSMRGKCYVGWRKICGFRANVRV